MFNVSAKAGLALPEGDLLGGPVPPVPEAARQTAQRGDRLDIKVRKLPNRKHWFKVTVSQNNPFHDAAVCHTANANYVALSSQLKCRSIVLR